LNPLVLFLSLCLGLFATAASAALKPGDAAPDFTIDAALGSKEFKTQSVMRAVSQAAISRVLPATGAGFRNSGTILIVRRCPS
jgi:hypothetical protein